MAAYWKKQLQDLIDSTHDRIRRLEAGEVSSGGLEATRQRVEAERVMIARLQKTIETLNTSVAASNPAHSA